jgi:hypothetical protein
MKNIAALADATMGGSFLRRKTMTNMFTAIGIATTITIGFVLLEFVADLISNAIDEAKWTYKYRHRFDKPPTAACYCIDCKFHEDGKDRTRCTSPRDHTADEWFCKAAKPKAKED